MDNDTIPSEESLSAEFVGNDDECPPLCWMLKRAYDRFAEDEESLKAEFAGNDELRRLEHNILTAKPLVGRPREILSEVMYACSSDVPPDYEEADEQTWLDKLRRFQEKFASKKPNV